MATGDGPGTSDAATADLLALEKEFAEALVNGDADSLNRLVSDDWIIIGPEGRVITRSAFLDVVKSGSLTHSMMELDETRVRVYGDMATVTARAITTGTYQGRTFATSERSTDVFVRQQGQWKCVLTQLTAITERHG
jgi:ketosteroid isomerase-like protein